MQQNERGSRLYVTLSISGCGSLPLCGNSMHPVSHHYMIVASCPGYPQKNDFSMWNALGRGYMPRHGPLYLAGKQYEYWNKLNGARQRDKKDKDKDKVLSVDIVASLLYQNHFPLPYCLQTWLSSAYAFASCMITLATLSFMLLDSLDIVIVII